MLPDHDARWRWRQLIWLAYLPLIVVDAVFSGESARELALLVLAIVVVVALLARAVKTETSLIPLVAFTLGLGLLLAPGNLSAVIFFAYAAGAAAHISRVPVAITLVGVVLVAATVESRMAEAPLIFSLGTGIASFVGLVNFNFASYRRSSLTLQKANAEIERLAAVAERERISRDLHDVLGHTLSLITLKSELAMKLAERDAPAAAAECRDVQHASRAALAEIRQVVRGYRTKLTDEVGRARALLEAAGVDADVVIPPAELSRDAEETLAFALREGVTNVVRYAGAQKCHVRLSLGAAEHVLDIEDDGSGIAAPEGNGLRGMRERVGALGGRLDLDSTGAGTRLRVVIPS